MSHEKKRKPHPWDKPEEDIPDVIWGGHRNASDFGRSGGVIDPAGRLPLPQMDKDFWGFPKLN